MAVLGLDHLIYGTPDLDASVEEIASLTGVRPVYGGSHTGRGTRNALFALGPDTYIEILAPDPAQPPEALARGALRIPPSPRLTTWAAKCNDLEGTLDHARQAGLDLGRVEPMSRARPDGTELRWRLTRGTTPGNGLVPFLIDWGAADHPARSAPSGCALRAEHPEPESVIAHLGTLGLEQTLPVTKGEAPRIVVVLATPLGPVELE